VRGPRDCAILQLAAPARNAGPPDIAGRICVWRLDDELKSLGCALLRLIVGTRLSQALEHGDHARERLERLTIVGFRGHVSHDACRTQLKTITVRASAHAVHR